MYFELLNTEESEQTQNKFEVPTAIPRKLIRNATITIPENKQKDTQVEIYENWNRGNYNLNDENIRGDKSQAIRASLFPLGMMIPWWNHSPPCFYSNLLRFKRGYIINEQDILENLDAVLVGEAQTSYQVNKRNWHNLEEFIQEFEQVYLNDKYLETIHNKIKISQPKEKSGNPQFYNRNEAIIWKIRATSKLRMVIKKSL